MKNKRLIQSVLFVSSAILAPVLLAAAAEDNYSSTLNNKSNTNGKEAFYLVKDQSWAEGDCIMEKGKDRINPGESSNLKIKKGCTWGVMKYKILSVKDNKFMGNLAHSFHDGKFSIELTSQCNEKECNFYDLNPEQNRNK